MKGINTKWRNKEGRNHGFAMGVPGDEAARQADTIFYCKHSRSGIRMSFYKDRPVRVLEDDLASGVGGKAVSRNDENSKKCIFLWE